MTISNQKGYVLDASNSPPRYVPKSEWSELPVQPPAGIWQRRVARAFPALIVAIPLAALSGINARLHFSLNHYSSPTWLLFWILLTGVILGSFFFVYAGIRGAQLEGRERQFGYSTWARKK